MNLANLLIKAARTFGERPALARGTEVICDYATYADRVARVAGGLRNGLGLEASDRVAMGMTNCPEYMELLFAAWHAGLVAVPMNGKLHAKEFAYILENSGAKAVFATPDKLETLEQAAELAGTGVTVISIADAAYSRLCSAEPMAMAEADPDDLAWLFYTSGTTGRPKGAMLSHRNLLGMTRNYLADLDPISEFDCIIHCAPISHGSGLYSLPHVARAAAHVIPESGGFDPAETIALIGHWPGSTFFFAPTMIVRLLNTPGIEEADLSNLKTITYGGGPMYVEDTKRALDVLGDTLIQVYGQGESPMTITWCSRAFHADRDHPDWEKRLASVGIVRTELDVIVAGEDDTPLPPGETGEILVRGDLVMKGYWQNPEATAASLRGGWLHTGDMGAFDEKGFLTLKDRSKDMIISGGSNIYPREIEEVLLTHPEVVEVSCIGAADPEWGEIVVAYVVAKDGAAVSGKDLDALCLDNLARFKRPKAYRFVGSLPKNNYGKVLKTELREKYAGESG